jgi:hypothetical protein
MKPVLAINVTSLEEIGRGLGLAANARRRRRSVSLGFR